ncbi:MAG: hydrolase [Dysgonamonadaceae bacterium]|jgi:nicotinamidase-related amidase|nr:hydrolase [Dysgonamonadaceae bacterium]
MSSYPIRDPKSDHLITPENAALIIIDYQPVQVNSINSMARAELINNIVLVAKLAKGYNLPIILSTVNVGTSLNSDTIPALRQVLNSTPSYDRTSINAWEDKEFREAVNATGRKKLLMTALWTEACLSFPTLDALKEGYEVYPIVDAVGGTSEIAHKTALERVSKAGAQLTTIVQLACELQRDWSRKATAPVMVEALTNIGAFLKMK